MKLLLHLLLYFIQKKQRNKINATRAKSKLLKFEKLLEKYLLVK